MKLLERHFEIALETPDGITKLRELILSLAMKGKLVPQDQNDQPASELLKKIADEKKKLIKEGKIKQQVPLPPIKLDEIPYELPIGWEWSKLGVICDKVSDGFHHSAKKLTDGIKYISATHIFNGRIDWNSGLFVSEKEYKELFTKTRQQYGDILIVNRGAGCGDAALVDTKDPFCFQNAAIIGFNQKILFGPYILNYLHASRRQFLDKFKQGGAQPMLSNKLLATHLCPLPPLVEQKRIVAKIDQLTALCDKLEAERNERDKKRLAIHTAAMNRLLAAADKTTFNRSVSFINKNFSALYSVPENVEDLKKVILQLAVIGKLVPQDIKDEPASELLKEIEAETKKLIKEGKIRQLEPLPPIKPEEIPYAVPKGWVWTRIENLFFSIGSKVNQLQTKDYFDTGQYPIVDQGKSFIAGYSNEKEKLLEISNPVVVFGDHTKNVKYVDFSFIIGADGVKVLNPFTSIYSRYFFFVLNSFNLADRGYARHFKVLKEKMVPLPPLAEQKRIVAKIDQLMELCNTLGQQIKDSTNKQTAILDAVLARL